MKSLVLVAFASIALSIVNALNEDFDKRCIRVCNKMLDPVCGSDGENFRIFPNECIMEMENCNLLFKSKRAFTRSPMRFCRANEQFEEECPKVCPFIYMPVCADNGGTYIIFPNKCELKKYNCQFSGSVKQTSMEHCKNYALEVEESVGLKKDCLKACTAIWDPICGFDGENYITFGNKCDMEVQTCLRRERSWKIIRKGSC